MLVVQKWYGRYQKEHAGDGEQASDELRKLVEVGCIQVHKDEGDKYEH